MTLTFHGDVKSWKWKGAVMYYYISEYMPKKNAWTKKKGTTGRLVAASADDDAELNY